MKALAERYLVQNDGGTIQDMEELHVLLSEYLEEKELVKLYRELELPLLPVLAAM